MSESFDAFLDAYAKVEEELRRRARADRGDGLAAIIRALGKTDRLVKSQQDDLLTFHELRNVIVHQRRDQQPIADPLPSAVKSLQRIAELLTEPPRIDRGFTSEVQTCTSADTISSAAKQMLDGGFSQIPVVDDGAITGLLTAETIARWYAGTLDDYLVEDRTVDEALTYTEDVRHMRLVARNASVMDALGHFDEALLDGYTIDALVITDSGARDQTPLGIITPFDVPRLHQSLLA